MANRPISEDAVNALVQMKIDALQGKLNESFNTDGTKEREWKAKISALKTVQQHLKFIETFKGDNNAEV